MTSTPDQQATAVSERAISRVALKALGELPGLTAGPLSPLTRIAAPAETADRAALAETLRRLAGAWESAAPALIDPGLTVLLMLAGAGSSLVGQFLWPDSAGSGPGFRLDVRGDDLDLTGPYALNNVRDRMLDALSLQTISRGDSVRITLGAEQLFVLAALIDSYAAAAARRRAARIPGPPPGFSAREIAAAWRSGLTRPDPAWSVSLFALLSPDAVPPDFEQRIPAVMREMAAAGLLAVLYSDSGDPEEDIYLAGAELDRLCRSLAAGGTNFGLAVQRRVAADRVEATMLGGWRTDAGLWLADISSLPGGVAELSVLEPQVFTGLMAEVFRAPASAGLSAHPAGPELSVILKMLQEGDGRKGAPKESAGAPAPAPSAAAAPSPPPATPAPTQAPGATPTPGFAPAPQSPPAFMPVSNCPSCGTASQGAARFCGNCGAPLPESGGPAPAAPRQQNQCGRCGQPVTPGAAFCGYCGHRAGES